MKKKTVTLYNMIFPIWVLWLWPYFWIFVLPGNFIVDLLVVLITMKCLKLTEIKKKAKAVILKVWICGFAADFVGTAGMIFATAYDSDRNSAFGVWWYEHLTNAVALNPFENIYAVLWVTVCFLITAGLIYFLGVKFCYRKLEIEPGLKKRLALSTAVFTAPYLFYLPTIWFY